MSNNVLKLKSILSKPSAFRNQEDIKEIGAYIINIKFFADFKDNKSVFSECCAYITYEYFQENEYIFFQGEEGYKFYILIQGQVSVLLPEETDKSVLKEVIVISDGQSFGDLALTEDKPRSATLKTKTECHLAVLDKNNYKRILASIMKKKRLELVEFLQSQSLFCNLTKGHLVKLSYCFEEKYFKKEQILFSEGEKIQDLYLIKQGDVILSKKVRIKMMDSEINKFQNQLMKRYSHRACISVVSHGEILGLCDSEIGFYSTSAIIISQHATLLKISLFDFKKRINNQDSKNIIDQKKRLKQYMLDENIQSVQKIIRDRVHIQNRKLMLSIQNFKTSENLAPEVGEIQINSSRDSSDIMSSQKKICVAKTPPPKIAKNFKISENSSFLTLNQKNSRIMQLEKVQKRLVRKVELFEKIEKREKKVNIHKDEFTSLTPKFINIMMPFGRIKSVPKQRKSSEILNIHIQHKKENKLRSKSSFRCPKKL